MNIILFEDSDIISKNRISLDGRKFEHIRTVLKLKVGDICKIGLVDGKVGRGRVVQIDDISVVMDYTLDKEPPRKIPITLIVCYPRSKTLKKVLQYAASLGVREIMILNSYRVDKSYWNNPILNDANIRHELLLGLEQSGDTVLPKYRIVRLFKPFVEDELSQIIIGKRAVVAHPENHNDQIVDVIKPSSVETVLFIGPEGGLIDYEVESLVKIGFTKLSLGERIQRVEVAVCVAIAKLF